MKQFSVLSFLATTSFLSACGSNLLVEDIQTESGANSEGESESETDPENEVGDGSDSVELDPCDGSPSFTNGQNATFVLGQSDFTSALAPNPPTASSLNEPYGNISFIDGVLFVPDSSNSRILGFSTPPSSSGAAADFALGQSDLTSGTAATSATGLMYPNRIQKYDGKYYVLDSGNHRLLRYDSAPTSSGATASAVVVGSPNLNTSSFGCSATRVLNPSDFLIVGGKLYVVVGDQNRVLGWNTVPTVTDTPADFVLGQPDLTTCDYPTSASANSMSYPLGVASDGTKLLISDSDQYRVLVWNMLPGTTGVAPDVVIGQTSFDGYSTYSGLRSASTVRFPSAMTVHSGKLYIADTGGHRVLIWNSIPTSNFVAADNVIGQSNFTTGTYSVSQAGLREPSGVFVCGSRLYVTQADSVNRISVFEGH
jgi:hypothetical protein